MKKIKKLIIIIECLCVAFLFGCGSKTNNEIYNKSYNVEINIQEFEDLVVAAIEKAAPAVIGVSNYEKGRLGMYQLAATGSGVIYSCEATYEDGTKTTDCSSTIDSNKVKNYKYNAVTNRHVVESTVDNYIKVYLGDEEIKADATLLGADDKVDAAVITFNYTKYIQPLEFSDSDKIKRGNFAIAIGNPSGYEYYGSATFGIISFPKRYISDDTNGDGVSDWDSEYIQHDVAINPGNSGGALINLKGELIGINTLKLISDDIDNMGFAIPTNVLGEIIPLLEKGETPQRLTLKISVYEVSTLLNKEDYAEVPDIEVPEEVEYGLYVSEVEQNGPAYGYLQVGDFILEFEGVQIKSTQAFRSILNGILRGETANIVVYRNKKKVSINIPF